MQSVLPSVSLGFTQSSLHADLGVGRGGPVRVLVQTVGTRLIAEDFHVSRVEGQRCVKRLSNAVLCGQTVVVVVDIGQEPYAFGTKVPIVLRQSESV